MASDQRDILSPAIARCDCCSSSCSQASTYLDLARASCLMSLLLDRIGRAGGSERAAEAGEGSHVVVTSVQRSELCLNPAPRAPPPPPFRPALLHSHSRTYISDSTVTRYGARYSYIVAVIKKEKKCMMMEASGEWREESSSRP